MDRIADEIAKIRDNQTDPNLAQRNERERRDLAAQEDSAFWAKWNFIAMIAQTLLSGGALTALLYDLRQNRKSAETQLRAYLSPDPIDFSVFPTPDGKVSHFIVYPVMRNTGQTPARNVNITTLRHLVAVSEDSLIFPKPPPHLENSGVSIGPNRTARCQGIKLSLDELHEIFDENIRLYVGTRAEYRTVFGKKHISETISRVRLAVRIPNRITEPEVPNPFLFDAVPSACRDD